tara:strand:+ start:2572 stop:2727 length:156 start_codon:yes stop_codon:yes gene_type:complete
MIHLKQKKLFNLTKDWNKYAFFLLYFLFSSKKISKKQKYAKRLKPLLYNAL